MSRKAQSHGEAAVRQHVHTYIVQTFLPGESDGDLRDDDLLFESGLVDSVGAMTLISYLSTRFQIEIADEDLYPENFESVKKISSFVVSRQRSGQKSRTHAIASD
jgi:acyl carrier protein